jgi:hypothetical protein
MTVRTYQRQRQLVSDADHRDGVELGVGQGGKDIGRPRPRGGEADRRPPCNTRHTLGDEARALFMTCQHVMDGASNQGVVKRQVGASGDTGHLGDALALQQVDGELGARSSDHRIDLLYCDRPVGNGGARIKKPPPVRTGRGLLNAFSFYPLRCDNAYTYHYYGPYYDIEQEVGGVVHIMPS